MCSATGQRKIVKLNGKGKVCSGREMSKMTTAGEEREEEMAGSKTSEESSGEACESPRLREETQRREVRRLAKARWNGEGSEGRRVYQGW